MIPDNTVIFQSKTDFQEAPETFPVFCVVPQIPFTVMLSVPVLLDFAVVFLPLACVVVFVLFTLFF